MRGGAPPFNRSGRAAAVLAAFADVTSLAGAEAALDLLGGVSRAATATTPDAAAGSAAHRRRRCHATTGRARRDRRRRWRPPSSCSPGSACPTVNARLSWSTELAPWPAGAALPAARRPAPARHAPHSTSPSRCRRRRARQGADRHGRLLDHAVPLRLLGDDRSSRSSSTCSSSRSLGRKPTSTSCSPTPESCSAGR